MRHASGRPESESKPADASLNPTIVLKSTDTQRIAPAPRTPQPGPSPPAPDPQAGDRAAESAAGRPVERRLDLLLQDAPLAVVEWDADFRIVEWNLAAERIFGYARPAALGGCVLDLFPDGESRRVARERWGELLLGRRNSRHTSENIRSDGRVIFCEWHCAALEDGQGRIVGGAAMAQDVTHRKRAEARLLQQALHDSLTGLPNRSLFRERLERRIRRPSSPVDRRFAVIFLDLDRFKVINDSLGHMVGDKLLVELSRRLESCLRSTDTVTRIGEHTIARLGGDEFTILLEDVSDEASAARVAERIQDALREPFVLDGNRVYTSASIGVALAGRDAAAADDLLRDADIAMYEAKAQGKARHVVFDARMRARAMARLGVENALRRAVDAGEFILHYQPIVDRTNGRVRAAEALIRWRQPELGLLTPDEFLPIAEETGLIHPIGDWVVGEAFRQMRAWRSDLRDRAPDRVSVNLSGKQFHQTDIVAKIESALAAASLPASCVSLEITETEIMLDARPAVAALESLDAMGVDVCIDDFGTGYSSLSHLRRLPASTLKIDRSFVASLESNSDSFEIVRAIVNLAGNLDKEVVAEGVETAEQFRRLAELDCRLFQGKILHAAMPPAAMTEVLSRGCIVLP
jgi:diguanylate cyclase (GGDEF)-like protein/PAS domain S-box-containing protein